MRLMYSKRDFAWLYDGCTQLAFLDGHVRAFEHFGGVPARCVYDNLGAAVKKVVLGGGYFMRSRSPRTHEADQSVHASRSLNTREADHL